METHTLKIPEFKFDIGDVIRYANDNNDGSIFVMISGASAEGKWFRDESEGVKSAVFTQALSQTYNTVVQTGSVYNSHGGDIQNMRPGINITFDKESLEKYEKIEFQGELTTPDTLRNIDQRRREWNNTPIE